MEIEQALQQIKEYQKKLGYTFVYPDQESQMNHIRALALAQFQEVAEFVDWTPWKPWRPIDKQPFNVHEAAKELVDQFFFMANLWFALGLPAGHFEEVFKAKLAENLHRIEQGYNKQVS